MGDSGLGLEPCHAGKSGGRVHEEVKHMFSPPPLSPPLSPPPASACAYGRGGPAEEAGAAAPEPGAAAGRTFGAELATLLAGAPPTRAVPLVVQTMVQFLEEHGLESEGLFRVNGSVRAVERLRQAWEAEGPCCGDGGGGGDGGDDAVEAPEAWRGQADVPSVAGLLKLFLRELPDGVVPSGLLPSFLQAHRDNAGDEARLTEPLRLLLAQLPGENRALLRYLCSFLVRVAERQDVNLMSPRNLGTVFGPNFFRVSPGIEGIAEQQVVNCITAQFITDFHDIFPEDSPGHAQLILVQELEEAAASAEETTTEGTQNPPPAGRVNGAARYTAVAAVTRKKKRNRASRVAEEASSSSSEARPESPDGAPCPSSARRDPPTSPPPASPPSPRGAAARRWPPPPAFETDGRRESEGAALEEKEREEEEEEEVVRPGRLEPLGGRVGRAGGRERERGAVPSLRVAVVEGGEDMDSSHSDTEPFSSVSSPAPSSAEALLERTIASTVEQHLFDTGDEGDEGGGPWDVAAATAVAPARQRRRQLGSPGGAQAADMDDADKENVPACEDPNSGVRTDAADKSDVSKKPRGDVGAAGGNGPGTPDDRGGLRAKRQRSNNKRGGQPAQEAMESAGGTGGTGGPSATDSETDMEEGKPATCAATPDSEQEVEEDEEEEEKKPNASQGEELADVVNTTTLSSLTAGRAPPPRNRRKPSRGGPQKPSSPPPSRGTAPGTPWKEENNNEVVPMEQEQPSWSPRRGSTGPSQTAAGGGAEVPLLDLAGIAPDTEWGEPVRLFRDWRSEASEPHLSPRPGRLIRRLLADEADPLLSPRCSSFSHSQRYHTDPEAPPSPPNLPSFMRPRSSSLGSREEVHEKEEVTSSQLSKRIQSLKKKIRRFEERFQEEHRYRPSHSDKVANPEVLKWMNELARSRKQLRELRLKQSQEETASGGDALTRQRSNTLPRSFGSSRPCELSLLPEFSTAELPSAEVPSAEVPSAEADGKPQAEGSPAGSPGASRDGAEQPRPAHRPAAERPRAERPTVEQTMEAIELRLKEKRQQAARPDSPKEMTREQIAAEKVAIQKSLLYFESIHGRPTTRQEKHRVKPLYDRYRSVKTLLTRARAIPIIEEEEGTDEEDDGEAVRAARPAQQLAAPAAATPPPPAPPPVATRRLLQEDEEQDTDGFVSPLEESGGSAGGGGGGKPARARPDPSLATLHAASREELMEHLRTTRSDKRRLRKLLRDFEDSFYRHTGRNVAKEDRSALAEQYTEYKHAKAKLRLLEALIGKQGAVTV